MRRQILISVLAVTLIGRYGIAQTATGEPAAELGKFFREFVGLTDDQTRDVRTGRAIAKILESRTPDEVFVFGAVYINSAPERYLSLVSDIDALRKLPSFIALGEFSNPPQIADLDEFVLDENDLDELKHCRPAHCEVQLPTEAIEKFQHSVDWEAPTSLCFANTLYTLHYRDFLLPGVTFLNLDSRLIGVGGQLLPWNVDGPEACASALIKGKELGR